MVFHPEGGRVSGTEVKGHSTQTTVVRGSVWLKWTDAMFLLSNVRAGPLNREHVKSVNLLTQLFTGVINSSHQSDRCIQQQECSECILVLNHWHFSEPAFLTNNLNINRLNQIRHRLCQPMFYFRGAKHDDCELRTHSLNHSVGEQPG